jgi:hypothetical protein
MAFVSERWRILEFVVAELVFQTDLRIDITCGLGIRI